MDVRLAGVRRAGNAIIVTAAPAEEPNLYANDFVDEAVLIFP